MQRRTINLFFLIDALGWEFIKDRPFLDDVVPIRRKIRTILGFSSAAIPSILTGKYPEEHGRWNLLYFSPETSLFAWTRHLLFLPKPIISNRVIRKAINIISKKIAKSEGYFSSYGLPVDKLYLFDLCEKKNIYRPGGMEPVDTIFDFFEHNGILYHSYSYHNYTDKSAFNALSERLEIGQENVHFVYLSELDNHLHHYCKDRDRVNDKIDWYEQKIRQIYMKAMDHCEDVRIFIFSDHGMTPIDHHYDFIGYLRKKIRLNSDTVAIFDSTMARFWFFSEAIRKKVESILTECSAGQILSAKELKDLKIYFPDGRYGHMIFLMNPGHLIYPNWIGSYSPQGMHGFHPEDPYSYAVYLSNVEDYQPECITDLFTIMKKETANLASRL